MIVLHIIIAVLLIIALLLFVPIAAVLEYGAGGAEICLRFGALHWRLYPRKDTRKKCSGKKKEPPEAGEKEKHGASFEMIMDFVRLAVQTLGRLRRSITVKNLQLHFCFGGEAPAAVALKFGGASAGAGMIVPLLQNNFRIKKMDISNSVDFNSRETHVCAGADISLPLGSALLIAATAGIKAMKIMDKNNNADTAAPEKGR